MWFKKKTTKEKIRDFLTANHLMRPRVFNWLIWLSALLTLFLIVFLIVAVPLTIYGARIINQALVSEKILKNSFESVISGDWDKAENEMQITRENIINIKSDLSKLGFVRIWPPFGRNLKATEQLLNAADKLLNGYESIFGIFSELNDNSVEENIFSFVDADSRFHLFESIVKNKDSFDQIRQDIAAVRKELKVINTNDFLGIFQNQLLLMDFVLEEVVDNTDVALPILSNLPELLGYNQEKNYLILFQNNMELRPTGGFIGSYGILKIKDGEIIDVFTDDIYNLDRFSEGKLKSPAPEPMVKYNNQKWWYLRDANWSPDWPISARQIHWFFNEERKYAGLSAQEIDGVIAINPDFISNLIEVLGPIAARGIIFNADDFAVDLEKFVEFDYVNYGIAKTDRKSIIGDLTTIILEEVYQADHQELFSLWLAFKENIDEKNILVYLLDDDLQQYFDQQNWSGQVKHSEGDYLMVVDSNLAALKTDQVMKKSIDYSLSLDQNYDLIAQLEVAYEHRGEHVTSIITRYRDYVRVYVPDDSWFLEAYIKHDTEKIDLKILDDLEIYQELGKRVSATFLVVEPGDTKTLVLKYRLPENIKQQYEVGLYKLLVQKQPGTVGHSFDFNLNLNKQINAYHAKILPQAIGNETINWDTDLSVDR